MHQFNLIVQTICFLLLLKWGNNDKASQEL